MFKVLRIKEIILLALFIVFVPSYAFYQRVIAPRFGSAKIKTLKKRIVKSDKKLKEEQKINKQVARELESMKQKIKLNNERIARMRQEADEFQTYLLSDRYEVELYQFLFGRDARYSVIGLGNNPKRNPKGKYTELVYSYRCKGKYADMVRLVKKIENVSRSLSISKLELKKPKQKPNEEVKETGEVEADMKIHAIFWSDEAALSFDEFKKNEPDLNIRKIDGDPWNANFGEVERRSEGPTGPVKKLFLESIMYMKEPARRSVKFTDDLSWYRIGDEFMIESRKSSTMVRLIAIGGRYVIIKHLNKNQVFKISLAVAEADTSKEQTNQKELMQGMDF